MQFISMLYFERWWWDIHNDHCDGQMYNTTNVLKDIPTHLFTEYINWFVSVKQAHKMREMSL